MNKPGQGMTPTSGQVLRNDGAGRLPGGPVRSSRVLWLSCNSLRPRGSIVAGRRPDPGGSVRVRCPDPTPSLARVPGAHPPLGQGVAGPLLDTDELLGASASSSRPRSKESMPSRARTPTRCGETRKRSRSAWISSREKSSESQVAMAKSRPPKEVGSRSSPSSAAVSRNRCMNMKTSQVDSRYTGRSTTPAGPRGRRATPAWPPKSQEAFRKESTGKTGRLGTTDR
jgi:hypothetical protein